VSGVDPVVTALFDYEVANCRLSYLVAGAEHPRLACGRKSASLRLPPAAINANEWLGGTTALAVASARCPFHQETMNVEGR
jgi:hypothetical protein